MATELQQMEAALAEGKTLGEALEAAPAATTAPAAQAAADTPMGPSAPPPAATDLDPYLAAIPESLREVVRPALQAMLDGVQAQAATAMEAKTQLESLHRAFASNPRGALQFLAEHYKVPVRFSDSGEPTVQPAPTAPDFQPAAEDEAAALLQQIERAADMSQVAKAVDRLTTLRAAQQVGRAVAPVAAAQLSQEEQRQLDTLRRTHPDIPVDALLPQIRRRQAVLRERPYLTPEEGLYIELGPRLIGEVRRLRGQLTRAASPGERAAAGVSGPGVTAPAVGATLDPYSLSPEQLLSIMRATGGIAPDR